MTNDINRMPSYLLFDVEGFPDRELMSEQSQDIFYKKNTQRDHASKVPARQVITKFNELQRAKIAELKQKKKFYGEKEQWKESTYLPITYQRPLFISVVKVASDYTFLGSSVLSVADSFPDDPIRGAHLLCHKFFDGWRHYKKPTLVSFYGRVFDLPLLKFTAYKTGLNVSDFPFGDKDPGHIDMYQVFSNFGSGNFKNGIKVLSGILGKTDEPFRGESHYGTYGEFVEVLYDRREYAKHESICLRRILDYYPIFLRLIKLSGGFGPRPLSDFDETPGLKSLEGWLRKQVKMNSGYATTCSRYLSEWGIKETVSDELTIESL